MATPITATSKTGSGAGSYGQHFERQSRDRLISVTQVFHVERQLSNLCHKLPRSQTHNLDTLPIKAPYVTLITYLGVTSSGMELRRYSGRKTSQKAGGKQATNDYDGTFDDAGTFAAASPATRKLSGSGEADAVVGAAVRGGSLLMLLALLQRASTFILNVLLQRAMLSGAGSTSTLSDPPGSTDRATSALEEYGAAAITLELISSTALFLAREPFRVALARSRAAPLDASRNDNHGGAARDNARQEAYRRRFVNTAWVSAPVGLAFTAVVWLTYPWIIKNDAFHGVRENRQAATLVCLAAALELLCEPLALIFQHRLLVDVRVRAEASAVLVLGVSRYLLVTRAGLGVISFGYAQLLHSATLAIAYLSFAARDVALASINEPLKIKAPATADASKGENKGSIIGRGYAGAGGWLPRIPRQSRDDADSKDGVFGEWIDIGKLRLAGTLAGQSVLKHALTEGDKIVLARASGGSDGHGGSLYEQGVYAIASGYGSLVARLLFQPLEEAARLMFSKLGAEEGETASTSTERAKNNQVSSSSRQGVEPSRNTESGGEDRRREMRWKMAALLATLLKLVLSAGLVFVCFGFHYTETLLRLLLARRGGDGSFAVSEVARVLSWYCVYVLFLAANGMCEAFACAVARGRQLTGMGAGLVVSFAAFWALVGPLTGRYGTRGLVMANAAGMACRVVVSGAFIRRFFLKQTNVTVFAKRGDSKDSGSGFQSKEASLTSGDASIPLRNLWRDVVLPGALPHPCVLAAMALSSAAAHATSPAEAAAWEIGAAARHVLVGVMCLGVSAALFVRFEVNFFRELRGLWAARRARPIVDRSRSNASVQDGRHKVE